MRTRIAALTLFAGLLVLTLPLFGQGPSPRFEPAQVISAEEPVYPANVVTGGTVIFEVTVGPTGEIENVRAVREASGFNREALQTVRKWTFKPAKLDGKPIRSVVPVAFSFSRPLIWWTRTSK